MLKNCSASVTFLSLRNLEATPEEAMQLRSLIKSSSESLRPYLFGIFKFWNFQCPRPEIPGGYNTSKSPGLIGLRSSMLFRAQLSLRNLYNKSRNGKLRSIFYCTYNLRSMNESQVSQFPLICIVGLLCPRIQVGYRTKSEEIINMYLYLTFDAKWTITNPICIHLMNLCQCTAVAKNANDFYLAAPLMQSRIAFGIQMHFVINFAANFFFRLTFFHLFHKVFQGCGIFFFNVVLVHLCIWQTRANTKRTTHS